MNLGVQAYVQSALISVMVFAAVLQSAFPASADAQGHDATAAEILRDYDSGDDADKALAYTAIGRSVYAFGWMNSYLVLQRKEKPAYCEPEKLAIMPEQAISILRHKIADQPNMADKPFGLVLLFALQEVFPCADQ